MSRIMDEVREEGIAIGREEGIAFGKKEANIVSAFKLIKAGKISYEDAKELWGLTPEEIDSVDQTLYKEES